MNFKKIGILRGDIIIIAVVIITAAAMLAVFALGAWRGTGNAVIYLDGEVFEKINTNKNSVVEIMRNDIDMTVEIDNGKVRISHSNCKNQNCVKSGAIKTPNQIIACIPNGVYILIEGEDKIQNKNTDTDTERKFDAIIG